MNEPGAIVCHRVGEITNIIPGCDVTTCQACKANIWIAPSSLQLLKEQPHLEVFCLKCATEKIEQYKEAGDEIKVSMARDAVKEVKSFLRGL